MAQSDQGAVMPGSTEDSLLRIAAALEWILDELRKHRTETAAARLVEMEDPFKKRDHRSFSP